MAEKYKSWDKTMLTFTIPGSFKSNNRRITNNRYYKMRELIKIKAYIAKLMSREDDIKYFANIELGAKYSNPHIHIQVWTKQIKSRPSSRHQEDGVSSITSSSAIDLIKQKTIAKFNLNTQRCHTSAFDTNSKIDVFHYVVKDYSKHLTDDELWTLEIQKKRYRQQLNKNIRFNSKSSDKYTQKIYRVMYRYYSTLRRDVDVYITKFIDTFFKFKTPKLKVISFIYGKLCRCLTRGDVVFVYVLLFIFYVIACCLSPP